MSGMTRHGKHTMTITPAVGSTIIVKDEMTLPDGTVGLATRSYESVVIDFHDDGTAPTVTLTPTNDDGG